MAPDARFARLQTDPRFRRAKQKNLKVEIDDRFKDVLQSEEFGGKGKGTGKGAVDKRGRPLAASHHADQLKHFYRLRSPSPSGEGSGEKTFVDYARGEGALSSSGSEDGSEDEAESDVEEEELELGGKKSTRLPHEDDSDDSDDSDLESDVDHLDVNLSEDENDPESAFPPEADGDEEEEEEVYAEPTKRIAAVNLDWDNLRAADLYAVFNSFLKPDIKRGESSTSGASGKLLNVKIYPSEFGKTRMAKEEAEGPGGGLFVGKAPSSKKGKGKKREEIVLQRDLSDEDTDEEGTEDESDMEDEGLEEDDLDEDDLDEDDLDEDDEESDDDVAPQKRRTKIPGEIDGLEIVSDVESDAGSEDINMDQLRQYQLERLRYYYAVATFSTVDAAMKVLAECNGTEFERTANMFDLTYVPEEMEFEEDEVKEEATKELKAYKGNDFVTDALRHSKVKLTWDQDDPNRVKLTRRNLTKEEIEEEDFKAFLASSGSESEEEDSSDKKKKSKKAIKERTEKLRAMLLNGGDDDEDVGDVWGKAGLSNLPDMNDKKAKKAGGADMEITFKPALSGEKVAADEENLTTLEKYQLRMKEKKSRKKEKMELKKASKANDEDETKVEKTQTAEDDFFGDSESDDEPAKPTKNTALFVETANDSDDAPALNTVEHFSMKDILKAEKGSSKKKRKRTKKGKMADEEREVELGPSDWKINVKDDRFKALHEEPEFAIDPSNPHFTKTKAMQDLLAERARIRTQKGNRAPVENKKVVTSDLGDGGRERDLGALVESVKRRMGDGEGKKRKRSRK